MADPTQSRIEVLSKDFKRDDNGAVLCTDRVRIKVPVLFILQLLLILLILIILLYY